MASAGAQGCQGCLLVLYVSLYVNVQNGGRWCILSLETSSVLPLKGSPASCLVSCLGLNSRSPLSETKSTSSSLSALSDSLNSSEGGDLTHGNEELRGLLALPSSAGSQSSSGSHSGSGTEDKPDKGKEPWPPHTFSYQSNRFLKELNPKYEQSNVPKWVLSKK